MQGIDPQGFMQGLAGQLDDLQDKQAIDSLLDELEYLMEVLDPALQGNACDLAERLRGKLDDTR